MRQASGITMQNQTITYQLATHYLPRIALRLECLFLTIQQACDESHPVLHHYALKNLIEILKLIEKPELKSRFLKELMRIEHMLSKSEKKVSDYLFDNLFVQIQFLSHISGRFGDRIHQNPFIQSVRFAQTGDQMGCELYVPQLFLWLETDAAKRQEDLGQWITTLKPLYDTVSVYLALLRQTAEFNQIDMSCGFYQQSLPAKNTCHLILLRMDKTCGFIPKIQLGHHGLSLRLCEATSMSEIKDTTTMVDLGICQL